MGDKREEERGDERKEVERGDERRKKERREEERGERRYVGGADRRHINTTPLQIFPHCQHCRQGVHPSQKSPFLSRNPRHA